MLDEIPNLLEVNIDRMRTVKLLGLDLIIKLNLFVNSYDVIVYLVMNLPNFSVLLSTQFSPLLNLHLQVINCFLRLKDQLL